MKKSKQLFCKHNYQPWANIYGDLINDLNSRTVLLCPKCKKRKFIKEYIEAPINYNCFFNYCALHRAKSSLADSYMDHVFKDKKQFVELFCQDCSEK